MATTPVSAAAPDAQPSLSPVARIFGVLFSPRKTFGDIVRRPSWMAALVVELVLVLVVCICINQRMNWRDYVGQQIEKSPQSSQMSAEQKQLRIEGGAKLAPIFTYVFGIGGHVAVLLLVSLLMWGAYSLMGGISTNFNTSFSIVTHAFLTSLVSSPLFILTLFLKPYGTIDLENPLATNLAAFLPDESAKWLVALCKSADIFVFWILILIAIGFTAVNPKKLQGSKPYMIAFTVYAVFVALRVGVAFIFS
jgi:hypothetical protein